MLDGNLIFDYTDQANAATRTIHGENNITHEAGTAYEDANATWTDAVDGEGIIYGVGDVNVSKPGIYYLIFDYTDDAGNAAETVTRTVNVLDRIAPEISLNGENEITHEAGTVYNDANATWTDAVDGSGIIHAEGEVDTTKPGTYILSYDYTDAVGNVAQVVARTINVVDAPVIVLNGQYHARGRHGIPMRMPHGRMRWMAKESFTECECEQTGYLLPDI